MNFTLTFHCATFLVSGRFCNPITRINVGHVSLCCYITFVSVEFYVLSHVTALCLFCVLGLRTTTSWLEFMENNLFWSPHKWKRNHHPLRLLMWKVENKHLIWTWSGTFGTNVNIGCICGLQKHQLITLNPGDCVSFRFKSSTFHLQCSEWTCTPVRSAKVIFLANCGKLFFFFFIDLISLWLRSYRSKVNWQTHKR